MMGLPGYLACSRRSESTVSFGKNIICTELAVLGQVIPTSPLIRSVDLEMVRG